MVAQNIGKKLPSGITIYVFTISSRIKLHICVQIMHLEHVRNVAYYLLKLTLRKIFYPRKKHSQDFEVPEKWSLIFWSLENDFSGVF